MTRRHLIQKAALCADDSGLAAAMSARSSEYILEANSRVGIGHRFR